MSSGRALRAIVRERLVGNPRGGVLTIASGTEVGTLGGKCAIDLKGSWSISRVSNKSTNGSVVVYIGSVGDIVRVLISCRISCMKAEKVQSEITRQIPARGSSLPLTPSPPLLPFWHP